MYFWDFVCASATFSSVTSLYPSSSLLDMDVSHTSSAMSGVTTKTSLTWLSVADVRPTLSYSNNETFTQLNQWTAWKLPMYGGHYMCKVPSCRRTCCERSVDVRTRLSVCNREKRKSNRTRAPSSMCRRRAAWHLFSCAVVVMHTRKECFTRRRGPWTHGLEPLFSLRVCSAPSSLGAAVDQPHPISSLFAMIANRHAGNSF